MEDSLLPSRDIAARVVVLTYLFYLVFALGAAGVAFADNISVSVQTLDRRNQMGEIASTLSTAFTVEKDAWEIRTLVAFVERTAGKLETDRLLPLSITWRSPSGSYLAGYSHLPDWGYGRTGSLVLSSQAPPALQTRGVVDFGFAGYEKLVGTLDSGGKHIFAHRLTLRPHSTLELTAAEVSIVSDRAAAVFVNYLPLWPVYLTQHLKLGGINNDDVNANMAVGGRWESPWGTFYGDLFVDDMPQDPSHHDAYLIAMQAGYLTPITLGERRATLGIEYTRANNWMYTLRHLPYSYTHHGYVLGHWIGPDSDLLDVSIALPIQVPGDEDELTLDLSYQRLRHGEGRIGDVWEDYGTEYARKHAFLTGVVETSHSVGLGVNWSFQAVTGSPPPPGLALSSTRTTTRDAWAASSLTLSV